MRVTLFAFALVAASLHLYARGTAQTPEQIYAGPRLALVAGSPAVIR